MPLYDVIVAQRIIRRCIIRQRANNEQLAKELALEVAKRDFKDPKGLNKKYEEAQDSEIYVCGMWITENKK